MIGETIGEVLAFGIGVALSPLAIVAAVVMLVAPGGARSAWLFLGGWLASLTVVSAAVLLLADGAGASPNGGPASWVSIVKLIVGALLGAFGLWQWRARTSGAADTDSPAWIRKLGDVSPLKAAGLGVVFGSVKPKNLLLAIGAGLAVAQVGASAGAQAVGIVVFVLLGSGGVAIPYAIHVFMAKRGHDRLVHLRDWMIRENTTIIAVLSLVIAAKLLGDALVSLAG